MKEREFAILMALMTALIALSIDAMLPALPEIGRDLAVVQSNDTQLILSFLFFGMSVGLLLFGPLSDSIGRKPPVYVGFGIFLLGCIISFVSQNLLWMLVGRWLQGFGLAAPRIVSTALVRDQYEGRDMARMMSFIMAVFILVPTVAPAIGQGILWAFDWRTIFGFLFVNALILWLWFFKRQPETLYKENRTSFSIGTIWGGICEVCSIQKSRRPLGYTVASGLVFGGFLGYLNSTQPVLQELYDLRNQFALYFGILALAVGLGSFLNGRWVMVYGMKILSTVSVAMVGLGSLFLLPFVYHFSGVPPLWILMIYLIVVLFCFGILFGNMTALAMEPLGHIAGLGAAVVGALSTVISIPLGIYIGQQFNGTVFPMTWGFLGASMATLLVIYWTERKE